MDFFKYAIVDIGANSVRMSVYDINTETGDFSVIDSARNMMGLASYAKDGVISSDGAGKLAAIIRDYLARANSYPCDKFSAFATASLRGISNAAEIVSSVKEKFGVEIEIISGTCEAEYDFEAICYRFGKDVYKDGVVIDMGGGSTELIMFSEGKIKKLVSLPIGCLVLGKNFVSDIKNSLFPSETEAENMRRYIKNILSENGDFKGKGENIYLIGGTGRAIAKIDAYISGIEQKNIDGYTFDTGNIEKIRNFLLQDSENGAPVIKKLLSDRLTTIIPGMTAYLEIFSFLGARCATVSLSGVREGYLIDFIRKNFSRRFQET